jgi:hypothetical protein
MLDITRQHNITDYFWAHQDIVVRGESAESPSFYDKVIEEKHLLHHKLPSQFGWAFVWFAYDNLAHVNVPAADIVGAWDMFIPYYSSDCDYNRRTR